jgi:hypothetical protein
MKHRTLSPLRFLPLLCALISSVVVLLCSGPAPLSGGGGTETVIGKVLTSDGSHPGRTQVVLLSVDHDPLDTHSVRAYHAIDTTDEAGAYVLSNVPFGAYTLQATNIDKGTRSLNAGIIVAKDTVSKPVDTLRTPGLITVQLTDTVNTASGYMYIPGTTIAARLTLSASSVTLDSVPSGAVPGVYYGVKNNPTKTIVRRSVTVPQGDTVEISNSSWNYLKRLYLNTTATGAQMSGVVTNFPVLVRLTSDNFNFAEAAAGGADLRFAKSDNTPLPYEIERWDAAQGKAEVWVKIDTVYGNDLSHHLIMYWGNPLASGSSNGAAVFDTSNGFQGVWHLAGAGSDSAADATVNHYTGTPYGMTAASSAAGMIGAARAFDGQSSSIQMKGTADSKLNFAENGTYSVSAWVYCNVLDTADHVIASKGDYQYTLQLDGLLDVPNHFWEFTEYKTEKAWQIAHSPATIATWKYIVGIHAGNKIVMYVDGQCADSVGLLFPNSNRLPRPRTTTYDVAIGLEQTRTATAFNGIIDEVRIASIAPGADWIKLCYMNQKPNDALVVFK